MSSYFYGMTLVTAGATEIIENAAIIVKNDRFVKIGHAKQIAAPADAEIVDLSDKTVLPGLIDSHIHCFLDASPDPMVSMDNDSTVNLVIKATKNMCKTLEAGFTTVRDLGGRGDLSFQLRKAAADNMFPSPRILTSGRYITMTGGHGHKTGIEADGTDLVRKAAREMLKQGADVIKVMATGGVMTEGVQPGSAQFTREEMAAATEEAHKVGKKAAAHAQGTEGIKNAIMAGIDSIEHGIFLDEEAVTMMRKNNTYLVPTLSAPYWVIEGGPESGIAQFVIDKVQITIKNHFPSFRLAHEKGVKIAMGTDAGTPLSRHGGNAKELELMVENGMSPQEAIFATTITSAELLGLSDCLGSIEVGKIADMVVFRNNPLDNISNVYNVDRVYRSGKMVYQSLHD